MSGNHVTIGRKGQPDLLALYRGRGIGIELKSKTGSLKEAQKRCREAWGKQGLEVFKVHDGDWDALGVAMAWVEEAA